MKNIIEKIIATTNISTHQAWWLLEFVTEKPRSLLQFTSDKLTPHQEEQLDIYIQQIALDHKPLAYILGWVPFLDLKLFVTPPTLIPRPETESWVDALLTSIKKYHAPHLTILDIGTGSGCIALSLAQALPTAHVYAIDIAQSAIILAQKNALENNITNITFIQSDLLSNVPTDVKFDLIVSNPPYIDPAAQLDKSVLQWEDHGALFANNQGMDIIDRIMQQAKNHLNHNSFLEYQLIMEIDASQGVIAQHRAEHYGFSKAIIKKDQYDRDRTIWIQ